MLPGFCHTGCCFSRRGASFRTGMSGMCPNTGPKGSPASWQAGSPCPFPPKGRGTVAPSRASTPRVSLRRVVLDVDLALKKAEGATNPPAARHSPAPRRARSRRARAERGSRSRGASSFHWTFWSWLSQCCFCFFVFACTRGDRSLLRAWINLKK